MEQSQITPDAPQVQPEPTKKTIAWKQGLLVGGVVAGSFALLNLAIWGLYVGRAYPGVKLGGQDVSNLDRAAIVNRLKSYTSGYILTLKVKDQSQTVSAKSLGLTYENETSASTAVSQGKNQWLPFYGLIYTWQNGAVGLSYKIDAVNLQSIVTSLVGTASVAPTDAKVVIEGENVRVEADKPGRGVDPRVLLALIKDDIAQGRRQAHINERPTEANVTTKEAEAMVPVVQQTMKLPVSLSVNGKIFAPGPTEIGKWITNIPDKDGKLVLGANQEAINAYVASIAGRVDVAPVNKQINMVNGEVRTVSEGKSGSALDRGAVTASFAGAISSRQAAAITGLMVPVAFKTRTNNSVDLNGKYIEVNLSRQHLWAYNDKQLVYDTPITSGATGAGFATIQGLFSIQAKQTNRNLNGVPLGYNYNVFVQYWLPFSGNYGMHDASWRSSFGGSDYYYGGSHGCVNLPTDAAAWVYNFVIVGTPVWVHS